MVKLLVAFACVERFLTSKARLFQITCQDEDGVADFLGKTRLEDLFNPSNEVLRTRMEVYYHYVTPKGLSLRAFLESLEDDRSGENFFWKVSKLSWINHYFGANQEIGCFISGKRGVLIHKYTRNTVLASASGLRKFDFQQRLTYYIKLGNLYREFTKEGIALLFDVGLDLFFNEDDILTPFLLPLGGMYRAGQEFTLAFVKADYPPELGSFLQTFGSYRGMPLTQTHQPETQTLTVQADWNTLWLLLKVIKWEGEYQQRYAKRGDESSLSAILRSKVIELVVCMVSVSRVLEVLGQMLEESRLYSHLRLHPEILSKKSCLYETHQLQ